MWFWNIFKLLSDSLVKPKRAACGAKSGKSRSVSKNNKSWFQRILVTENWWKTWSVVSASPWKKKKKEIEFYQTEKVSYSNKTHLEVLMIKWLRFYASYF